MNLQELTRKYVEIDVKAMEDVLNFIRRRQRAEKELDDDFDYSMLYEYILKEQEYVKMKVEEKAIREEELLESKNKHMREISGLLKWLDTEPKISNEPIGLVYSEYVSWADTEGITPINRIKFGRELNKEGWVSKPTYLKGKVVRVYEAIEE